MRKQFGLAMAAMLTAAVVLTGCGSSQTAATTAAPAATTEAGNGAETTAAGAEASSESKWKTDTVTIYVPTKAGNQADLYIRFITPVLKEKTGKNFVVVNQTDGNGKVAYETVRKADPNGENLLYFLNSMIVQTHTGVYDKTVGDNFTPVAVDTSSGGMWMIVKADSPYQTVQDIIDAAKAKPGTVSYGMTSGQALHLLGGEMQNDIGAELSMVDAGGNSERLISLLGGNIDFTFVSTGAAEQYLESKEIRVLGCVTGNGERDPLYPDIPSVTEEGLPSTMFGFDTMLLGPAGMDADLTEEINAAFQEVMEDPAVVDQFAAMKNTMTPLSVADSAKYVADQDTKIAEVAKSIGLEK